MKNGWIPINRAKKLGFATPILVSKGRPLLLWVAGHGCAVGYIYWAHDQPEVMIPRANGYTNVRFKGFRLLPKGP